jgi:hypothetical protein
MEKLFDFDDGKFYRAVGRLGHHKVADGVPE